MYKVKEKGIFSLTIPNTRKRILLPKKTPVPPLSMEDIKEAIKQAFKEMIEEGLLTYPTSTPEIKEKGRKKPKKKASFIDIGADPIVKESDKDLTGIIISESKETVPHDKMGKLEKLLDRIDD